MKYSAILLALVCVMTACSAQKKAPPSASSALKNEADKDAMKKAEKARQEAIAKQAEKDKKELLAIDTKCGLPQVLTTAALAGDAAGFLDKSSGQYELQEIHAYGQVGKDSVSSFYEMVTVSDRGDTVNFETKCKNIQSSAEVSIPVLTSFTVHAPSQRLMVQDADTSESNPPHLGQFNLKSDGSSTGEFNLGVGPLEKVLSFKDLSAKWPKDQKLTIRPDGKDGFQVLYTDLSNGFARVLMVYGRSK